MATRRTTQRSTAGRKLYAVRDAKGRYEDIQTYERAHGQDVKRKSKAELAKKAATPARPAKKTATRKGATRKGTGRKT